MIHGLQTKKLKKIKDERGYLMEILRADDPFFEKFGQVYLTTCRPGYAKAWHYHDLQNDHFCVVKGMAKVALYDGRENSPTKGEINDFEIGEDNPMLIFIPRGVYHGFTALGDEPAVLINTITETYNHKSPDEHRAPFNDPEIGYDWGCSEGDTLRE